MVAFGPRILCRDAEPYYYDYLCGPEAEIPQPITDHIRQCEDCGARIRELEAAVGDAEVQDRQSEKDADLVAALGLHFAHIGEEMTCAKAKPYLPVLLVPSLKIRIPTPVTVHVDHCSQCSEDLKGLRELDLRPGQLARLSRLYAAAAGDDPQMCRRARAKTWAFACASFEGIEAEVLDHMCVCPRCRRRAYRRREKVLAGRQPGDTIAGVSLCSGLSTADLFEWVVPYGRTGEDPGPSPAGDETMPSHLRTCPECTERMQSLHRTIYGIAERVDSGVSTIYRTDDGVASRGGRAESFYCGYPIHVEVAHRDPAPAMTLFSPIARLRAALQRFNPVTRVALAAMLPLAILLAISIRPASGTREQQLTDTIKGIENVHVRQYVGDESKLVEEQWIARGAGLAMVGNARNSTVYDFRERKKATGYLHGGTVERASLTAEDRARFEALDDILRQAMSGDPVDKGSSPLAPDAYENVGRDSVIRELAWDGRSSDDLTVHHRQRSFLDPVTGWPRMTKLYDLTPDDPQWRLMSTWVFEYPSRQEVEATIRDAFPVR
jgi:hypothetical protein